MPPKPARGTGRDKALTWRGLLARKSWKPLPSTVVLSGTADLLKKKICDRFVREVFEGGMEEVRRLQSAGKERQSSELSLATVLDELRTPSFFSPRRVIVVERAATFLAEHGEAILPFIEEGFAGGHLVLWLESKLDGRTKFAKSIPESVWIVDCAQPYDRPPPWETRTPVWESELSHWLVALAIEKGMEISLETAYVLHDRAGTDLGLLDEKLEKIKTLLQTRGTTRIDETVIHESVGDLREDSVFQAVELFLQGQRSLAMEAVSRLFTRGYHTEKGAVSMEPTTIAILFTATLLPRLRALRRAHAMAAEGALADDWIAAGIVQRPFIQRFERELKAIPPRKLVRLIDKLYELDKGVKSGAPAARLLELLIAEFGEAG